MPNDHYQNNFKASKKEDRDLNNEILYTMGSVLTVVNFGKLIKNLSFLA